MYYLNDNHPEYEYAVYCRMNQATPYIKATFDNKKQLEEYLKAVIRRHNQFHQSYYLDVDFYENEYPENQSNAYYKVLRRTVNDWQAIN